VIVMIILGVAFLGLVAGAIWYVVTRGRHAELVTERDFDDTYDDLVHHGQIADGDRDSDWKDFHAWQVRNEEERRSWEEPDDA